MHARTTAPFASLVVLSLACGDAPEAGDSTDDASEPTGSASADDAPTASADDATDPSAATIDDGDDDDGSSGADDAADDSGDDDGSTGAPSRQCDRPLPPGLPDGAPAHVPGEWIDISPPDVPFGNDTFTQGLAIDPCDPAILYLTVSAFDVAPAGLFKSTDAGANWRRVGAVQSDQEGVDHIDEPIRVRIDPQDTQHLYVVDGVRGATMGFWVSNDGGETFTMPQGFRDLEANEGIFMWDCYDVAVDPTDFQHLLVSSHSPWSWDTGEPAGVLESKDGGESWILHAPQPSWAQGHAINFLYAPEHGLGDAQTWLLGTQNDGMWRTTDAGESWTKVSDTAIQHGGGTIYYASNGVVYASGTPTLLRSTDNGATWEPAGPSGNGFTAVHGDGEQLYTNMIYGPSPFSVSPEDDGVEWTSLGGHEFGQGPFEMAFDSANRILYTASWNDGLWAMALP